MRAITAANGCIRAEPHGRAITGSRVHSSRSTTDGIRVIPRNRISWSVQPATRFGHFHDCCRRQPIMFCQLSLRVGSDPGRQEGDVDFVGHTPSPGVVLFWPCPHLWSHSFPPDLPSPHVWLLPGGEISLDTPLSYPVVACASRFKPFQVNVGVAPDCKWCH